MKLVAGYVAYLTLSFYTHTIAKAAGIGGEGFSWGRVGLTFGLMWSIELLIYSQSKEDK